METKKDLSTVDILRLYEKYKLITPGLTATAQQAIRTRIKTLCAVIEKEDGRFDIKTVELLLALPYKYSYRHRLAKILIWCARWAVDEGHLERTTLSRVKLKLPSFEHTKISITEEQLAALINAKISGPLHNYRNTFIVQCLTGWAFSDVRQSHNATYYEAAGREWIKLSRKKNGKIMICPADPRAVKILEEYGWRLKVPTNQRYNLYLKEIAARAGIQIELTSHMARKTFAQHWLNRGASPQLVAQMLANSERVLMAHYGGLTEQTLDSGLRALGI